MLRSARAGLVVRTLVDVFAVVALTAVLAGSLLYFNQSRFLPDRNGVVALWAGVKSLGLPAPGYDRAGELRYRTCWLTGEAPLASDEALRAWAAALPDARGVTVTRKPTGGHPSIDLEFCEPKSAPVVKVPWKELGYVQNGRSGDLRLPYLDFYPCLQVTRLLILGCLQIAVLIVAVVRLCLSGRPRLPLTGGGWERALVLGLLAGVVLAALAWGYDALLRATVGPTAYTTFAWSGALLDPGIERQNARGWIWLAILAGSPLIHELYFRGALFGVWAAAGHRVAGLLLTAALAALARLDGVHVPLALVAGLIISEVYRRAQHLLAPILAHVGLNLMLLGLLTGGVPGYPDVSTRMVGTWMEVTEKEPLKLVVRPDGRMESESEEKGFFDLKPTRSVSVKRIEWTGSNTILLRDSLFGMPFSVEFAVTFDGFIMTLTSTGKGDVPAGTVVRYRWVSK